MSSPSKQYVSVATTDRPKSVSNSYYSKRNFLFAICHYTVFLLLTAICVLILMRFGLIPRIQFVKATEIGPSEEYLDIPTTPSNLLKLLSTREVEKEEDVATTTDFETITTSWRDNYESDGSKLVTPSPFFENMNSPTPSSDSIKWFHTNEERIMTKKSSEEKKEDVTTIPTETETSDDDRPTLDLGKLLGGLMKVQQEMDENVNSSKPVNPFELMFKSLHAIGSAIQPPAGRKTIPTESSEELEEKEDEDTYTSYKCPSGYSRFNKKCYKVFVYPTPVLRAKNICKIQNATLTSIHSGAENKFLVNLFNKAADEYDREHNEKLKRSVLIGLIYNTHSKQWEWMDGSGTLNSGTFSNWAKDEPNYMEEEHYAFLETNIHPGYNPHGNMWNNVILPAETPFICSKITVSDSMTSEEESSGHPVEDEEDGTSSEQTLSDSDSHDEYKLLDDETRCTAGYSYFQGYCYKALADPKPFIAAAAHCTSQNSSLASIHSMEENDFIVDLFQKAADKHDKVHDEKIKRAALIGLVYNTHKKQWEWMDGTGEIDKHSFTNWAKDEPNWMETEHYAIIEMKKRPDYNPRGNMWNNVELPAVAGFICNKRAIN